MNTDPRGYYKRLQVSVLASPEEIKLAYRNLAKRCHPDANKGQDTTIIFQMINEAYSVLSDPDQRRNYDLSGAPITQESKSQTSRSRNYERPLVEPYRCADCHCVSPKLRHVLYTQVVSCIVVASRKNIWGIYCEKCAKKRLSAASAITGACGWFSVPGIFLSAHALSRNLLGGKRGNLINLEICFRQAVYYQSCHDTANSRIATKDAFDFANAVSSGWWNPDEKRRASELKPLIDDMLSKL